MKTHHNQVTDRIDHFSEGYALNKNKTNTMNKIVELDRIVVDGGYTYGISRDKRSLVVMSHTKGKNPFRGFGRAINRVYVKIHNFFIIILVSLILVGTPISLTFICMNYFKSIGWVKLGQSAVVAVKSLPTAPYKIITFPGKAVHFLLMPENWQLVMAKLDLVKSKNGILHPQKYGLVAKVEQWAWENGYWARWVGEKAYPQLGPDGITHNGPYMLMDVYKTFTIPVGWNLVFYNVKVICQATYPLAYPYVHGLMRCVRDPAIFYKIIWQRIIFHFLYWVTDRPCPRRYNTYINGNKMVSTPGQRNIGVITEENLEYSRAFRRAQIKREFSEKLRKFLALSKEKATKEKELFALEFEHFKVVTRGLALIIFSPALLCIHESVHARVFGEEIINAKPKVREAPCRAPWLTWQEIEEAINKWEADMKKTYMFEPFFDPCCLIAVFPIRSESEVKFEWRQRLLINQTAWDILKAQNANDAEKVEFEQQKFEYLLNLREG